MHRAGARACDDAWVTDSPAPDAALVCPRCGSAARERFYGPCAECRTQLRRTLGNEARAVEREAFVPAMHVTPNAVALKE
jgi:hypothetical protein